MQIFVRKANEGQDLALIEMQGDLESRLGQNVDLSGKFIGDLHFTKDQAHTPILIIGHHILYGKSVKLEKPLVIMTKVNEGQETEYQVKTIIRTKLIFKARPKPIIVVPKKH